MRPRPFFSLSIAVKSIYTSSAHARVPGRSWHDFPSVRMQLIKLVVTAQLNVSILDQNIHSS